MAIESPAAPEATPRGRRNSRASGDERERAILATAQQLLEERPLSEISVADLAAGAGISRPTFYFYFSSRDAVLLTLVERMAAEAGEAIESRAAAMLSTDPRTGIRQGIEDAYTAFASRRAAILAAAELQATNAEAREVWSRVMEGWVAQVSKIIEAERARGAAPPGPPARDMAIALVQMNERVQRGNLAAEAPSLSDGVLIDTLVEIWMRSIYGAAED
ncbi:MAG: TetR/AcrR family transcriptional regulator, ethionamide resistance regulator [Solirubrobacterales bacterium]|jgi:AcrR family transcriptional regulator|nr:TetR/AcrR family transcriptional regulator, ethionamide resistance regulator [Solirubrobacterales bacterium]